MSVVKEMADDRADEYPVLRLFQRLKRSIVQQRRMVDHVDAVAQAHPHGFGTARVGGKALAMGVRNVAYRGDF